MLECWRFVQITLYLVRLRIVSCAHKEFYFQLTFAVQSWSVFFVNYFFLFSRVKMVLPTPNIPSFSILSPLQR